MIRKFSVYILIILMMGYQMVPIVAAMSSNTETRVNSGTTETLVDSGSTNTRISTGTSETLVDKGNMRISVENPFISVSEDWVQEAVGGDIRETLLSEPPVEKPYEQVIGQNGPWYVDSMDTQEGKRLVTGYEGSFAVDGETLLNQSQATISVKRDMVLSGIYIPFISNVGEGVTFSLQGASGNVYGPYTLSPMNAVATLSDEGSSLDAYSGEIIYSYEPMGRIALKKDDYTLVVSASEWQVRTRQTGPQGAYLIKGLYEPAYKDYRETISIADETLTDEEKTLGTTFEEDPYGAMEKPPVAKPAFFSLDAPTSIEEVIVNTINGGMGVLPGVIAILSEDGSEVIYADQAYGLDLEDVPNGMWAIAPEIVLPEGTYQVGLSDPSAITYDTKGEPLFYVTISEPKIYRFDYTGTYRLDLEAIKKTTLMGAVSGRVVSFSLDNFELTVVDRGEYLELIGRYEGMPFSQRADILDITEDTMTVGFDFNADLSGLPAKTRISARVYVQFVVAPNGSVTAQVAGGAEYERAESKDKGADYNTYDLEGKAVRVRESLPPYVVAALGAAMAAGNMPGPDNAGQVATGLLFPPLVGVVVHVLQEALKKQAAKDAAKNAKAAKKSKIKKYSKEWYKQQYPEASDEDLAWIMLADAMGNTDEPDEGDLESQSDEVIESDQDSDSNTSESSDHDGDRSDEDDYGSDEEDSSSSEEEAYLPEKEKEYTEEDFMSEEEKADRAKAKEEAEEAAEEAAKEPEPKPWDDWPKEKTLQTGIDGKTTTYELDPETGEYVNPLTNGVLDMEVYEKVVAPNLEKDQAFVDEQRRKIAAGDTAQDKALKEMLQKEKNDAAALQTQLKKERLMLKYGVKEEKDLEQAIRNMQDKETEAAKYWNKIGDNLAIAEGGAVVVGAAADATIDFMGDRLGPVGKVIRATYKVTKAVASDVATAGKEANWNTVGGAVIKGANDAAGDFINSKVIKGALTVGAETYGSYVQAKPGEEAKGIVDGLVGGVTKVVVGAATDKIGGDGLGHIAVGKPNRGVTQVVTAEGKNFITKTMSNKEAQDFVQGKINDQLKQHTTKIASAAADYYGIKPVFTDPTAAAANNLIK